MLDITAAIKAPGTAIPFVHKEALEDTQTLGEQVTFPESATFTGTFRMVDEALIIKGSLTAKAQAHCARCLAPVTHLLEVAVDENFLRVSPREEDQAEDDPWEERQVFSGNRVDLSGLANTLALLELPIRFLCPNGCEGVPEQSGETEDSTEPPLQEPHPFDALKQLYTKFQEE